MKHKRVVILGCGPAGLMAAYAAEAISFTDIHIFSRKEKSVIHGAQYLHKPIPGLSPRYAPVEYRKHGSADGYAKKVYGDPMHATSWSKFEPGVHDAWNMQDAYNELWAIFEDRIIDCDVTPLVLRYFERSGIDLLISSIPAPVLCEKNEHVFESAPMWVMADRGGFADGMNIVCYNGDPAFPWYRSSCLWGHEFLEFGAEGKSGIPGEMLRSGHKPVSHTCDCHPEWMRVGRFGKWQPGVLAHSAFQEVTIAMHQL
jgi:hypothetical protein